MMPAIALAAPLHWVKAVVAITVVCVLFLLGWGARGIVADRDLARSEKRTSTVLAERAQTVAAAASAALAQSEEHRSTESALRRRVTEADHARNQERAALASRAAAADRAAVGLRQQLDQYACFSATSPAAGDPGAAASDPTTTLGELLGPVFGNLRALARAAEAHASDVRALRGAWPRTAVTPTPAGPAGSSTSRGTP